MPTVRQSPADVDKFVAEMRLMNIKWVVFLNDNTNIGDNDYLVERLVANGIMPIMRLLEMRKAKLLMSGLPFIFPIPTHLRAKMS
jgi:hypothetical protein